MVEFSRPCTIPSNDATAANSDLDGNGFALSTDPELGATEADYTSPFISLAASAQPPRKSKWRKTRRRGYGISVAAPGLHGSQRHGIPVGANPNDYEQKYPEDDYCEELGPNARVWRVYQDEADVFDNELVEGWKDTIDVLLVFAGLFSAVVTTFVVQTSQALQPDYAQVAAALLTELVSLQRATANDLSTSTVSSSPLTFNSPFSASPSNNWVNGLWFISLAFSLSTALLSVLIKQWIQHYMSSVSGTIRDRVYIRQYRLMGLKLWLVPVIVGLLPVLLHISLLLFLTGLIVFLLPLNKFIGAIITIITISAYVAYTISNLLPLTYPDCPYKTPLSTYSYLLFQRLAAFMRSALNKAPNKSSRHVFGLRDIELDAVIQKADVIEAEALIWLFTASSNPTVASIVLQSVSGLRTNFSAKHLLKRKGLKKSIQDAFVACFSRRNAGDAPFVKDEVNTSQVERLGRSLVLLRLQEQTHDRDLQDFFSQLVGEGTRLECPELVALGHCNPRFDPVISTLSSEGNINPAHSACQFVVSSSKTGLQLHPTLWFNILNSCFAECRLDGWQSSAVDVQAAWQYAFSVFEMIPLSFYSMPSSVSLDEPLAAVSLKNPNVAMSVMMVEHLHTLLCRKLDRYWSSHNQDRMMYMNHILLSGLNYIRGSYSKNKSAEKFINLLLSHISSYLKSPSYRSTSSSYGQIELTELCQSMQTLLESDMHSHISLESYHRFLTVYEVLASNADGNLPYILSWSPEEPPPMCSLKVIQSLVRLLCHEDGTAVDEVKWKLRTIISDVFCEWFRMGSIFAFEAFRLAGGIEALRQIHSIEEPESDSMLEAVNHDRLQMIARVTVQFVACTLSLQDEMEPDIFSRLMDYMHEPSNLLWFCQVITVNSSSGISLSADYTKLITLRRLAQVRPMDPVWQQILETRVQNTRLHQNLHYSLRQEYLAAYNAIETLKGILELKDHTCLKVYEYVSGDDIADVPRYLSEVDGLALYAPYAIPFHTFGQQTIESISSFHATGISTVTHP